MSKIMKIRGIVGLFGCFLVGMICVTVSNAATKCIAMGPGTSCRVTYNDPTGQSLNAAAGQTDWGVTCGDNIIVHGISTCGHWKEADGRSIGSQIDSVTNHIYYNDGAHEADVACYCKIVQPVVSRWTFAKKYEGSNGSHDCDRACSSECAYQISNNTTFRDSILGTLFE